MLCVFNSGTEAQGELKALEFDPDTCEEQITSMVQHIKGLKYCFRSWDPRCTLKWMDRYSWVALNIPYIITHKMAMHRAISFHPGQVFGREWSQATEDSSDICRVI